MNDKSKLNIQNISLSELIDIPAFQNLSESFFNLKGIPISILDLKGEILIASDWMKICTKFHRKHTITASRCLESDTTLASQLTKGSVFNIYQCKNGLIDAAVPIVIENVHLGNLFVGQFLFEKPDIEYFENQAEEFGFDKVEYLRALAKVPILSKEEIRLTMEFLKNLTIVIGSAGIDKIRLLELNNDLEKKVNTRTLQMEKEKRFSDSLISSLPGIMYVFDECGTFINWNQNFQEISGYSENEILNMNPLDFISTEDKYRVGKAIDEVFTKGNTSVEAKLSTNSGKLIPFLFTGYKYTHENISCCIGVGLDISDRVKTENEKEIVIRKLQKSISKIKVLSGLLPICASCKKIRDDEGYWEQIESYLSQHTGVDFTHGYCPDCMEKMYYGKN